MPLPIIVGPPWECSDIIPYYYGNRFFSHDGGVRRVSVIASTLAEQDIVLNSRCTGRKFLLATLQHPFGELCGAGRDPRYLPRHNQTNERASSCGKVAVL